MRSSLLLRLWHLLLFSSMLAVGLLIIGGPTFFSLGHSNIDVFQLPVGRLSAPVPSTLSLVSLHENDSVVSSTVALVATGTRNTLNNERGAGAGDSFVSTMQQNQKSLAGCLPLDMTCLTQAAFSAILTPITQTITAFCDAVLQNIAHALAPSVVSASPPAQGIGAVKPALGRQGLGAGQGATLSFNFLTQTPLCFSTTYSTCAPSAFDATVAPLTRWAQMVVASALALLLVVGGFCIIIGQQVGWSVQGVAQLLPRVALCALAAFIAPSIVQVFIDLNNLLCQGVLQAAQITSLATIINMLSNPLNGGGGGIELLFLLAVVIVALLFIGQMALRLAFVTLLGALAPLGLLCFALPFTQGWGRLWMQQLSLTIFVQFLQVTTLALGGALLAALSAPTTTLFIGVPNATPIVESILLLMLFYLAFRLPTMLPAYAARHVTSDANNATMQTLEGAGELLALLVA